jgi:hypothetical protein
MHIRARVEDIPDKVIPQTVLDEHGLPKEGDFFTRGQQIIQVSRGVKPILITGKFDHTTNYQMDDNTSIHELKKKDVLPYVHNLLCVSRGRGYLIFRKDTLHDAFLLYNLETLLNPETDVDIFHVLYGYLLGYSKQDILAWFMTGPIGEAIGSDHTEYYANKSKYDTMSSIQKIAKTYPKEFEVIWKHAMKKLKQLRSIPITEEFEMKVTPYRI